MKTCNPLLYIILTVGCYSTVTSQNILRVDDAIKIAIERNYDVRIAKNETAISDVEDNFLNSGYLPKISASAGISYANEAQNVTFSDGSVVDIAGAITEAYNASITAEYTIFDGFERKFTNQKNIENFNLKKLQERQEIENTIIDIYDSYYNVAYQKQIIDNLSVTMENSRDRLARAKRKLKYGQGSKLEELNAQVDLNNDSISYASAYKDYKNIKRHLNVLLGRDVTMTFQIDTTVVFSKNLQEEEIMQSTLENNITSLVGQQNILLSEVDIQINQAKFLPKVTGSASYNWNQSINPVTSFALENEVSGVNLGMNLSWNIFDGGASKTRTKTARIVKENREIELFRAKETLKKDVYNAYTEYVDRQFIWKAEKKNVATNKLNFSRTQKQFNLGQVNAIEYRQAQINLLNALNNVAKAKYDVKIAEINLLQFAGMLLI